MAYVNIPPIVSINEPVIITITTSYSPVNGTIYLPNGAIVSLEGFNLVYVNNDEQYSVYEVSFTPTRAGTHHFVYQAEDGNVQAYFEVVSSSDGNPIILNYPSTVKQMQAFNWSIEFAKPGETVTIIENGPVNITRSSVMEVRGYNVGYNNFTSQFEYAGTYTVTCNFSRSSSVSTSITVTPNAYIVYPSSVVATEGYSYSISGGNPNESWSGIVTGPSSFNISGVLDGNGNGEYSGSVPSAGSYNIDFTFSQSGKYKHSFTAVPNTRNGIHGFGTPITFSEINAEFLVGYDLDTYRNRTWYIADSIDTGLFSNYDLNFYQFYNKKAIDPAIPGTLYYANPGYYEFTTPLYRNSVIIEAWGGGGGAGGSGAYARAGDSTVIFPGNYIKAGGGESGGGGGRRTMTRAGEGGIASGGQTNLNGNKGGYDVLPWGHGGTGASAPNGGAGGARGEGYGRGWWAGQDGKAPGGGAGGASGQEGGNPKYDSFFGSGGGGSGAYCSSTVKINRGTILKIQVGTGRVDAFGSGGNGAVKITWS